MSRPTDAPIPDAPETRSVRVHDEEGRPVLEVTVAAPVATVWEHLRDKALIARWHGWDCDELDEEIDLIYVDGAREADEPHVLETRGGPAPGDFALGDRFDVREVDGAAVVRITRGPRGTDPDWDAMYDDVTQGWISFLAQLRFAVERTTGARRTVFLYAPAPAAASRALLGLDGSAPADAPAAPVDDLAASTWFRTTWQAGATVEGYGPGLVVAADAADPDGGWKGSMVIVSTYGLDDAAFEDVETAWRRWWVDTHPEPAA